MNMRINRDDRIFILKIDHSDRIIFVNEHWLNFARENDADGLIKSSILGQSLWKFICDDSTIHLYQTMLARARKEKLSFSIPFRCDSPDYRRFMEMKITPSGNEAISFESWIVKLEPREHVGLFEAGHERSDELIRVCSYCKKIFAAESGWHDVEEAITLLDLFSAEKLPQITHTICPSCYRECMKALNSGKPYPEDDIS